MFSPLRCLGALLLCIAGIHTADGQTIGGAAAFSFLNLSIAPIATANGGKNISIQDEIGLTAFNPALLKPELNKTAQTSFSALAGGVNMYGLTGAVYNEKFQTTFGAGLQFVNYGRLPLTDASGNASGEFRPVDFSIQVSASRSYLQNWRYGASLKFIQSNYGQYKASGLAADVGINFTGTTGRFSAAFLARNMGTQLTNFAGTIEDLPFDLLLGLTHRLEKAPLGISVTAQGLHRSRLSYRSSNDSPSTATNVLHHFIPAAHIYLGKNLEAHIGYNALQRYDLSIENSGNGLAGLSGGFRAKLKAIQFLYAYSSYQRGVGLHQFGVTVDFKKLTILEE